MNPFRYGQVVTKSNYCQRPSLEKLLRKRILSGQNTYIEGERRTGKTSLIFETANGIKGKWIVYVDLLEVKTVEDIYKRMLNGIAKAKTGSNLIQNLLKKAAMLRPSMTFDPMTGLPSISIDTSVELQPESLEGLLDLFGEKDFRNAVIVIDEFQDIRNLKDAQQALAIMRSKIQFLQVTPFVFCGSIQNEMHLIFNDPHSPFFKSALPLAVGPIDRFTFLDFIKEKFNRVKIRISPDVIDKILQLSNNNPGDTQQLCSAVFDVTDSDEVIDENTIIRALIYIFGEERKGYESILARITSIQLKCLTAVAQRGGKNITSSEFITRSGVTHPATIKKAMSRLEDLKIVFRINGEYRFVNPFFAQWLVHMNY